MKMQTSAQLLESYSRLKVVLGSEQASELINFLNVRDNVQQENFETTVATKADIFELKADISELRQATTADISQLKADISQLRQATKADISELRQATKADISESKSDMIKWMFIFWIGGQAATVGIILAVFKH